MSDGIAKELIKSDKRNIFPLFAFGWMTFSLFEVNTSLGSVSVATDNNDMPVYIGVLMVVTWLIMLYIPPPERRKSANRDFNLSYITRNLVERVRGDISYDSKSDWMLFTEAQKIETEHHHLPDDQKNETLNGLQLDLARGAGLLEGAVLDNGDTILRQKNR